MKTGGYKEMTGGYLSDLTPQGENNVVMVYEPEKNVKKEVKVVVIDGGGRTLIPCLRLLAAFTRGCLWNSSLLFS